MLINFWATWCIPCRTEIPDLVKLQRQYRSAGLRVVGITYPPEEVAEVRRFARSLRINYRIAIGTKATKALFTASETLPMTIVIDRDGQVREVIEGIMYEDEFDEKVKPLLSSTRPGSERSLAKNEMICANGARETRSALIQRRLKRQTQNGRQQIVRVDRLRQVSLKAGQ